MPSFEYETPAYIVVTLIQPLSHDAVRQVIQVPLFSHQPHRINKINFMGVPVSRKHHHKLSYQLSNPRTK